jgi:DUF438 domain-containing protein
MNEGKIEKASFLIDLTLGDNNEKKKVMIEYYALRDKTGSYLGCMEASQNISEIQKIEGENRLLD